MYMYNYRISAAALAASTADSAAFLKVACVTVENSPFTIFALFLHPFIHTCACLSAMGTRTPNHLSGSEVFFMEEEEFGDFPSAPPPAPRWRSWEADEEIHR